MTMSHWRSNYMMRNHRKRRKRMKRMKRRKRRKRRMRMVHNMTLQMMKKKIQNTSFFEACKISFLPFEACKISFLPFEACI
jgi:hypothetical protein